MEHQELRELLENLRVDATDVQPNDSATLQQLLTRALEKAQRLSEKYTERGGLNLGTLDRFVLFGLSRISLQPRLTALTLELAQVLAPGLDLHNGPF